MSDIDQMNELGQELIECVNGHTPVVAGAALGCVIVDIVHNQCGSRAAAQFALEVLFQDMRDDLADKFDRLGAVQ